MGKANRAGERSSYDKGRAVMKWQPIETAPKDGTIVLLYCPVNDGSLIDHFSAGQFESFAPYQKEMGKEGSWHHYLEAEPTHWMPLPDAPRS
jgi:hypothetical protein